MRKELIRVMCLFTLLTAQSLSAATNAPKGILNLHVFPMQPCKQRPTAAVVDIIIPPTLDFTTATRNVTHKFMTTEPDANHLPPHADNGTLNTEGPTQKLDLFSVYTSPLAGKVKKKELVMVRVIIPNVVGRHLQFHQDISEKPVLGVGAGIEKGSLLCQKKAIDTPAVPDEFQVVAFFFDTTNSVKKTDWTFSILLEDDRLQNTPITIDPKVHDTGWGLMLNENRQNAEPSKKLPH